MRKIEPTELSLALGRVIRDRRVELGLSQIELAQLARLSQSSVSRVETGHASPYMEDLARLADALQTLPSTLVQLADQARSV